MRVTSGERLFLRGPLGIPRDLEPNRPARGCRPQDCVVIVCDRLRKLYLGESQRLRFVGRLKLKLPGHPPDGVGTATRTVERENVAVHSCTLPPREWASPFQIGPSARVLQLSMARP